MACSPFHILNIQFSIIILASIMIACSDCGKDEVLGAIPLSDKTFSIVPYDSGTSLLFENENGVEIVVDVLTDSISMSQLTVATLCDEGIFDNQHQTFDTQIRHFELGDENDSLRLNISLQTLANPFLHVADPEFSHLTVDSIHILDMMFLNGNILKNGSVDRSFNLNIKTDDQQLPSNSSFLLQAQTGEFIGDTILFDQAYSDVFKGSNFQNNQCFYNAAFGLLGVTFEEGGYWKLKM